MTNDRQLTASELVLAAVKRGEYDEQLGISPETRDLLTRAAGDGPLTLKDVRALNQLGHHAIVDAAHEAGRIQVTEES